MNIDQIRDEVAEMMGCDTPSGPSRHELTTIDGIAALWPKGWRIEIVWHKGRLCWTATGFYDEKVEHDRGYANRIGEGTTEYEARLRLLHAVLTAERNAK